ncbi:hypothetical protein EMCRGX_G015466 [Ephydatia muelleri]
MSEADRAQNGEESTKSISKALFLPSPCKLLDVTSFPRLRIVGASFGAVKVAVDPTHTTDCLLVLKLFEAGTLEQQPEGPLLSAEAQTGFEFLLNSWLATLAIVGEEGKEEGPLVSALPVRVTGLLQTVINGSRCLVVGVASSAARSHPNRDVDTAGTQALQDVLDRVTVKEALTPVLVFASKYMQLAILEEPCFYWHSLYTAASHQSAEAFSSQTPLETTVCVVPLSPPFLGELVLVVVQEVYRVGLDLAGVRLLYDQSAASLLEGNGTETGGDLDCHGQESCTLTKIYKILVKNDKILVKNDKILTKIPKIFSLGSLNCTRVRVSKMSLRATTNLMRVKHNPSPLVLSSPSPLVLSSPSPLVLSSSSPLVLSNPSSLVLSSPSPLVTSPQWSSEGHVILKGVAIRFVQ